LRCGGGFPGNHQVRDSGRSVWRTAADWLCAHAREAGKRLVQPTCGGTRNPRCRAEPLARGGDNRQNRARDSPRTAAGSPRRVRLRSGADAPPSARVRHPEPRCGMGSKAMAGRGLCGGRTRAGQTWPAVAGQFWTRRGGAAEPLPSSNLEGERLANAADRVSALPYLIAFTRRARLFLGGDTGPMHLAAALRIPVVAIFGPTDPARNGPYGTRSIVLRSSRSVTSYSHRDRSDAGLLAIAPA